MSNTPLQRPDAGQATSFDPARLFASVLLLGIIAGLIAIFVSSSYFENGSMASMLAYRSNDIPSHLWPEMYPDPFGIHYFGDFLDTLRHSQVSRPFDTPDLSPVGYPLFSLLVIAPFGLVGYAAGLKLFLLATVLVLLVPLWCLVGTRPVTERLLLVAPLLLCAPMLVTLDRANLQGLVVGAAMIGCYLYLRGNRVGAGCWFAVAAAMKVYPVLLLLLLVRDRDWRALGASIVTGLTATWVSFLVYGGGVIENSESLWQSVHNFRSESIETLLTRNHSLKGGLAALVVSGPSWLRGVAEWAVEHYDPSLLVLALFLGGLTVLRSTPTFHALVYVNVLISYGVGISFGYVPLFLLLPAAAVYASDVSGGRHDRLAVALLACLLVPKGLPVGGHDIALYTYLDPTLAFVLVASLAVSDVRRLIGRHTDLDDPDPLPDGPAKSHSPPVAELHAR